MRLLVHLSKEHPSLPEAELAATLAADGFDWRLEATHGRIVVGDATRPDGGSFGPVELAATLGRLAMTHEVSLFRFEAASDKEALDRAARAHPPTRGLAFAVRAERSGEESTGLGRGEAERTVGAAWADHAPVDLARPERTFRAWLTGEQVLVGERLLEVDRGAFEARRAKNRPYFSPISGHPRIMRAIVNLGRAPPGGVVYDPLCGTGGILIEAGTAGYRPVGSDIDPAMIAGSAENCAYFGVQPFALFASDVRQAVEQFRTVTGLGYADAVVTDLPYGQSAFTTKVGPREVTGWALEATAGLLAPGSLAVVGCADPSLLAGAPASLVAEARYDLRVHRTMTRTYTVFRRR